MMRSVVGRPFFEGVGELAGAFGAWGFGLDFSRRSFFFGLGGVGLFCLVLQKGHEQLVAAELLALAAVEAFEQGSNEVFLLLEFGFERGDPIPKGGVGVEQFVVLLDELGGLFVGHEYCGELRHP